MQIAFRGRSFRPSALGFLFAVGLSLLAVALGNWQMRRADERRAAGALLEAALRAPARPLVPAAATDLASYLAHKVSASGRFDAAHTYFLANRSRGGRPGYEVLTPLKLSAGGQNVLVLRGWLPADAGRGSIPAVQAPALQTPAVQTPAGDQLIEGIALGKLSHALQPPGHAGQGRIRQNLSIVEFAAATGLQMLPLLIEQHSDNGDGLQRDWPKPDTGADKNTAYAMQWYSLGALAIAIFVVLSFRRKADAAS